MCDVFARVEKCARFHNHGPCCRLFPAETVKLVVWGYVVENDPEQCVLQDRHGARGDTRDLGDQALVRHGKWENSAAA